MLRMTTRATVVGTLAATAPVVGGSAGAHNAGHFFLPDGSCHAIGSFRDAPTVGPDGHQLDLIPETPTTPFDEYGASFAAFQGGTPILPGGCPR